MYFIGYEGLYQVSNLGRVKSLGNGKARNPRFHQERIRKPSKTKNGYLQLNLCKNGEIKLFRVNRLVANAFIQNPENKPCVNHKDENKENNCVCNLEWCDNKYNVNYGTRNERVSKKMINNEKLSKKVLCIETNIVYSSTNEAKRQTGIHQYCISCCCKGKYKIAGKFHWKYVD